MKFLPLLIALAFPFPASGQNTVNGTGGGITDPVKFRSKLDLQDLYSKKDNLLDSSTLQNPFESLASDILVHDNMTGADAVYTTAGATRAAEPGPGSMSLSTTVPGTSEVRYEKGQMRITVYPQNSSGAMGAHWGPQTAAAGLTFIATLVPNWTYSNPSQVIIGFYSGTNLSGFKRGCITLGSQHPYAQDLSKIFISTLANDTDESAYVAGYGSYNPGDTMRVAVHYKTLSNQQYYIQGGAYSDMGFKVGSNNWFMLGETFATLSGTVYPGIVTQYNGTTIVKNVQVLSKFEPSPRFRTFDYQRSGNGVHIPSFGRDPVTGLAILGWNNGIIHAGSGTSTIRYSVRLANGKWTDAATLIPSPESPAGRSICSLSSVNGALRLVYWNSATGADGGTLYWRTVSINPSTGVVTLGAETLMSGLAGTNLNFSPIITLPGGRLMMPYHKSPAYSSYVAVSDDNGSTWTESVMTASLPAGMGWSVEPTMLLESDGGVGCYFRTSGTERVTYYSRCAIPNASPPVWSTPVPVRSIPQPGNNGSRLQALTLANGRKLVIGNDSKPTRRNITIWEVGDNGTVLGKVRVGDTNPVANLGEGIGTMQYPAILGDGDDLLIAYSEQPSGGGEVSCQIKLLTWRWTEPVSITAGGTGEAAPISRIPPPRPVTPSVLVPWGPIQKINMSYGNTHHITLAAPIAISSCSSTSTTLTFNTSALHYLAVGDSVTVTGCSAAGYNSTWTVASLNGFQQFTVASAVNPGASTGGSLNASGAVIAAPTNANPNESLTVFLTQAGTGSYTVTWNSAFDFRGYPTTLNTAVGAYDMFSFRYNGVAKKWVLSEANGQHVFQGGAANLASLTLGSDTTLYRGAAATLELGLDHATAPTNQTVKAHDVTTGTGAKLTLSGGAGSVAGGDVSIATSATNGAAVERFTVQASGNIALSGTINETRTAQSSARETLFAGKISDSGNDVVQLYNSSATNSNFVPALGGASFTGSGTNPGLMLRALTTSSNDGGTIPLMQFESAITSSSADPFNGTPSAVSNRPLFRWTNGTVTVGEVDSQGKWTLGQLSASAASFPPLEAIRTTSSSTGAFGIARFTTSTSATMAAGLASQISFGAVDSSTVNKTWGVIGAVMTTAVDTGDLYFSTSIAGSVTEGMRLTSDNKLLVGSSTSASAAKLQVAGAGTFTGDLTANKITTTGSGSSFTGTVDFDRINFSHLQGPTRISNDVDGVRLGIGASGLDGVLSWTDGVNGGTGNLRGGISMTGTNQFAFGNGTQGSTTGIVSAAQFASTTSQVAAGGYFNFSGSTRVYSSSNGFIEFRNAANTANAVITAGNVILTPASSVTPANNGELTIEATNNATLTFKYKGTDGVVRQAQLSLAAP